jgi:hypothetical protein
VFCYIATLLGFFFICRYDAVKFLVNDNDKKEEAIKAIAQVYKYANTREKQEKYYSQIKSNCGKNSSNLTFNDAVCNP